MSHMRMSLSQLQIQYGIFSTDFENCVAFDSLLQYPIGNLFETDPTNDIGATLRSVWDEAEAKPISLHSPAKQSSKRCQLALLLSSLARMDVQQRACRKKADCKLIEAFDRIVMS
eukprot:11738310-Ditylum_brightwellii.AAC.1